MRILSNLAVWAIGLALSVSGAHQALAQTLIVAQGTEPETLDAQATAVSSAHNAAFQILERLVLETQSGTLVPHLAVSWGPVRNDRTWRFKLRPNVSFTDGEPLDAEAVKFSIERLLKPDPEWGSSVAHYVQPVASVTVVDKLTVEIITKSPFGLMPKNLVKVAIVPPAYVKKLGNAAFGRDPVGTGPFMFKQWSAGQYIRLVRNEKYWGKKPKLAELEFRAIPDPETRVSALLAGDVHLITQLPVQDIARVKGAPGVDAVGTPSLRNMVLTLNTLKPGPLKDVRVRQALNYAIDKQAIVDKTLNGYGKVLRGQTLTDLYFGFNPKLEPYPYDPAKARELLAAAGYKDGLKLDFAIPRGRYMNDVEVSQTIAAYLEAVGIQVNILPYEWAPYIGMLTPKKLPDLSLWGWAVTPADADSEIGQTMSTHPFNYYINPNFDDLMFKARAISDESQRLALYAKATALAREEAPNVWLYQQYDLYGVSKAVKGWKPSPDEFLVFTDVTLEP